MTAGSLERASRIAALRFDYASQPVTPVDSCNLCGHRKFVVITHRDRYGFPAEAHACVTCGLVFLNPRMTAEAYGRFYEAVYRPLVSAYHGRLIDAKTIQEEQTHYAAAGIEFLRPFVSRSYRSLLDIGGSTGVVASRFAREFNLTATVLDPAPLELDEARRLGLDTITGLVEEHDFSKRRFDMVLLCQTVDHLLDIDATLRRVRALLTAGGVLFADIVDFRAAYRGGWSVEGAIKIDHPYYLTDATMRAFLERAGFHIMRSGYDADGLHIRYVCSPAASCDVLPDAAGVNEMLRDIRFVQNTPGRPVGA